jgi:hypothetical protein
VGNFIKFEIFTVTEQREIFMGNQACGFGTKLHINVADYPRRPECI